MVTAGGGGGAAEASHREEVPSGEGREAEGPAVRELGEEARRGRDPDLVGGGENGAARPLERHEGGHRLVEMVSSR